MVKVGSPTLALWSFSSTTNQGSGDPARWEFGAENLFGFVPELSEPRRQQITQTRIKMHVAARGAATDHQ